MPRVYAVVTSCCVFNIINVDKSFSSRLSCNVMHIERPGFYGRGTETDFCGVQTENFDWAPTLAFEDQSFAIKVRVKA